jgi:peptide/nickel transport system permease protein
MLSFIVRRLILAVFTVIAISILTFIIIHLPPGDYVTTYVAQIAASGGTVSEQEAQNLRALYGLDQPIYVQYIRWVGLIARGNFGIAMEYQLPVAQVIGDRLWLTVAVSTAALVFTWVVALPIGIYSAVRQHSILDYVFTFIGFIGLALPNFLLALLVLYFGFKYFDANIGGLFKPEFADAPWSWAKFQDLLGHLPIPAVVLGMAATAAQIRIMRANLLDEKRKPYVMAARVRGLPEHRVILTSRRAGWRA